LNNLDIGPATYASESEIFSLFKNRYRRTFQQDNKPFEAVMPAWNMATVEQAFADAAVDPSRWNAAMDVAGMATGSFGAALLPISGYLPNFPCSGSVSEGFDTFIRDGWYQRDARVAGVPTMNARGVMVDLDIMNFDDIKRHAFYQEFLAPQGLRWFAGVKVASGDDLWCLAIQRSIAQGPFSPVEQKALAKVSTQLSSAAALARAVGFAGAQSAVEAFELSGSAVVLLNRRAEIIRLNPSAEKLLGRGLRVAGKRLVSHDSQASAALDRALRTLLWNTAGSALHPPVALPRTGLRPLLAYPVKLSGVTANVLADCQALLVLVDPEKRGGPPEASLRSGFGLTAAEARLAARLAAGETIDAVAGELGIAKETARNQLKSIFAKTGVRRQAELVALFARLLGG
jgi:DNA-binding CsgD family transcriptional regulator